MQIGFNHDEYTVRLPKEMGGGLLELEVSTHLVVALRVTPMGHALAPGKHSTAVLPGTAG